MSAPAGNIGYYGLGAWWLETFSADERELIRNRFLPLGESRAIDQGETLSSTMTDPGLFLHAVASWFSRKTEWSIVDRIEQKVRQLADANPIAGPGYYRGRHFVTYVEEVKQLKRDGRLGEAEALLLALVEAAEQQAIAEGRPSPPWYADQLGIVRRKIERAG